eukprot:5143485-Heterocapsa_arctica.AAC.1
MAPVDHCSRSMALLHDCRAPVAITQSGQSKLKQWPVVLEDEELLDLQCGGIGDPICLGQYTKVVADVALE